MSSNAERLAAVVLARREELALTQLEVAAAGGPSNTTLTMIENGLTANLTNATAKKLDRGLQWAPGSARAVWFGGDPTPLDTDGQLPLEVEMELLKLTPAIAERVRAALLRDQQQQRDEGRRSG